MSNITLSAPVFYRAGVAGVSPVVGVESNCSRVARYSFTAPATGACAVSVDLAGAVFVEGTRPQRLGFFIGTDPVSHANGGTPTGYLTGEFSGSAELLLLPNTRYYLFIFPVTADYGWYTLELATVTLTASGGSYSVPTLSASTLELGKTLTIQTNPHDAAFTHRLTYSFAGTTGVIAENAGGSCTWTPPLQLACHIPNGVKAAAVISCATYRGGTQLGDTQNVTVTLTVPASVVPTVSFTWEDVSAAAALGLPVKLVSKLALTVGSAGALGSSITATTLSLNGKPYAGGVIMECGDLPLTVTVQDSRGRTGSATQTLTVADYETPQLRLTASRCDLYGTADDAGEYCHVTLAGKVFPLPGQTGTLAFSHGETVEVGVGEFSRSSIIPAPSAETMTLGATLSDALSSTSRKLTLSVGYATLDVLAGGRGIAFGTTATREGFTCAMDAYFSGELYRLNGDEKEWLFPPMEMGVEYRTAERFVGLPVYTKLVQLEVTESGESTVQWHGETVSPIRHAARFYAQTLPFFDADGNQTLAVRLSANNAIISCALGWVVNSNNPIWLQVWYHK